MDESTKSNLTLAHRKQLEITGIKRVKSTEPALVVAEIDNGHIIIGGTGLSVEHLDVKQGNLIIHGLVNSIKYSNQVSKSFSIKNMFK